MNKPGGVNSAPTLNRIEEQNMEIQKVAYWPNGLWCDPETAALAVDIADFPSDYKIVEFPADADPAFIDSEIAVLLAQ